MERMDLLKMDDALAFFEEEAGLHDIDWAKISSDLACIEAEKSMENTEILSNLNPGKTALFLGTETKPTSSDRERQEYHRHTRQVLMQLLKMGITTILLENSAVFGFFALEELVRQRQKHEFTLLMLHRDRYTHRWLHTPDQSVSRLRSRKSIDYYACCDKLICSVSKAEWIDICTNHIAVAITEQPPYYCNRKLMTEEHCNTLETAGQNKIQELRQRLIRDDERMTYAHHSVP